MNRTGMILVILMLAGIVLPFGTAAYPLNAAEQTGIWRLEGYRLRPQPAGALLALDDVDLRLLDHREMTLPEPDPAFTRQVRDLIPGHSNEWSFAVLDLSDLSRPRYAEWRGTHGQNPGSVGKLLILLAVYQALADVYPESLPDRERVLKTAMLTADRFIVSDHHKVPFFDRKNGTLTWRPVQKGDRANLYTYLDWMASASSNAAASMCLREAMLIRHFGRGYPPAEDRIAAFFDETAKAELKELLTQTLLTPVSRNGLDPERFRQGGFFTHAPRRIVPQPTNSYGTPREIIRYGLLMEQGRLVDVWSSREIKRLLYMTQRRIRYASSPALKDAAVYFKSGSLYQCEPEPGFTCGKYRGNRLNLLNSLAIVEHPAPTRELYYMSVVMTNILKKNAAVQHQSLGTFIQRLMAEAHRMP